MKLGSVQVRHGDDGICVEVTWTMKTVQLEATGDPGVALAVDEAACLSASKWLHERMSKWKRGP
jgi:hypothetical protein